MADGGLWEAGEVPWVRRALVGNAFGSSGYAQCYFCGEMSAKISDSDLSADNGRVEIYCDNGQCDARTAAVLITRDGHHADRRADVRILDALDRDSHTTEQGPLVARTLQEIADSEDPEGTLARRTTRGPASYASPPR